MGPGKGSDNTATPLKKQIERKQCTIICVRCTCLALGRGACTRFGGTELQLCPRQVTTQAPVGGLCPLAILKVPSWHFPCEYQMLKAQCVKIFWGKNAHSDLLKHPCYFYLQSLLPHSKRNFVNPFSLQRYLSPVMNIAIVLEIQFGSMHAQLCPTLWPHGL